MSVHCDKISKGKHGFVDLLVEIPHVCNCCFKATLTSPDSKSRNQGEGNRAFSPSRNFQKHFKLLGTASSYKHFAPHQNISLVGPCVVDLQTMAMLLSFKVNGNTYAYLMRSILL